MKVNTVRNVNYALHQTFWELALDGEVADSRNGIVTRCRTPVITITKRPWERVLFCAQRNANPFFHLMESIWMMAGRNDLAFITQFNSNMKLYSDDGVTQPAAYGHRWRTHFGVDQLDVLSNMLALDPTTRRAVLGMWDPVADDVALINNGADVPCNTHCYFTVRDGFVNMTVFCRSNDMLWGAHGANAVHFSILLEFMARTSGYKIGTMTQYSHDMHLYAAVVGDKTPKQLAESWHIDDRYAHPENPVMAEQLLLYGEDGVDWLADASTMCSTAILHADDYRTSWFKNVALPVYQSWEEYKSGDFKAAYDTIGECASTDWAGACTEWLDRAKARRAAV
jgi:thymidylate synthase